VTLKDAIAAHPPHASPDGLMVVVKSKLGRQVVSRDKPLGVDVLRDREHQVKVSEID
jgi:hypothetical protein